MAWTGAGAGTIGDPWQITTRQQLYDALYNNTATTYMKVMNNIDCSAYSNYLATFTGHILGQFDGNGKSILNIATGLAYDNGLTIYDNSVFKDITLEYNRSLGTIQCQVVYAKTGTGNVTIQNIHAIATGNAKLNYFSANYSIPSGSTVSDITIEGNFLSGFAGTILCPVSNVRLYRTLSAQSWETYLPYLFSSVSNLVYRCQIIVPSFLQTGKDVIGGMIVRTIQPTTIIRQCRILANINITQLNPTATTGNVLHIVYGTVASTTPGSIVEDCLIEGNYFLNGGEATGGTNYPGKSGYILGASAYTIHRRNIFIGDLSNSYFNNRVPMSKSGISAYQQSDLFFNSAAIVSMNAIPEAGKQIGLNNDQMKVQSNFTNYDFTNIWQLAPNNPDLINNQIYTYSIALKAVNINSTTRISGASFSISISIFAVPTFGIDILDGETIVLNSENNLNPTFSGLTNDHLYTIKPYYYEGVTKVYTSNSTTYQHYFLDIAVSEPTVINETALVTLNNPINATLVHGSIFFDGYWYGATRNLLSFSVNDGLLIKAPENNISAYQQIPIRVSDPVIGTGDVSFTHDLEAIVLCKGKLYATFYNDSYGVGYSGHWLLQYDPATSDYKVYQIVGIYAIAPLISDGEFLYFNTGYTDRKVYKVDPDTAFVSLNKFNPNPGGIKTLQSISIGVYNEDSQGGYIDGGYSAQNKGTIHSAISDSEYLYLAYTTPLSNFISGYDPENGKTYCELHKVRKSDMTPHSWIYIPQCTDDMTQNATHLFLGIEVQPAANVNTYGYGWGALSVRKSDLNLTKLKRLHANDNTPNNQSYGSLMFGSHLIDLRTNKYIVVLDISDPDSWSFNDPIGSRTQKIYTYKYSGVQNANTFNEIVSDTNSRLYATEWGNPAKLAQFTFPDLNIYSTPILENPISTIDVNGDVTLSAHILSSGGQPVTARGFRYGNAPASWLQIVESIDTTDSFETIFTPFEGGTWYWQPYASNSQGTTYGSTQTLIIVDTTKIYFAGEKIKKIYLGTNQLKFN